MPKDRNDNHAMVDFFVGNIWIWLALALVFLGVGFYVYMEKRETKVLLGAGVAGLLVFLLGLALNYWVETDHKSIVRFLNGLSAAIVADDQAKTISMISPQAKEIQALAKANMSLVRLDKAVFQDLTISVNREIEPPVASLTFTAIVLWRPKSNMVPFDRPAPQRVKFRVDIEKNGKSWLITDRCTFDPKATP